MWPAKEGNGAVSLVVHPHGLIEQQMDGDGEALRDFVWVGTQLLIRQFAKESHYRGHTNACTREKQGGQRTCRGLRLVGELKL